MRRRMRNRIAPRPIILLYHRVTQLGTDPQQLAVTPAHFAEHLEVLGKHARIMRLSELVAALARKKLPRRGVVLTFDDGYADNLHEAKPLLVKHEMPATVFVTTGLIGRDQEFFWDELDRLLLQPGKVPATFEIKIADRYYRWELSHAQDYSRQDAVQHRKWHVGEGAPTMRHTVYRTLCDFIRPMPPEQQQNVLWAVRQWAGAEARGRASHKTLRRDGLLKLAEGGLVEIGAHTAHHPMLAALPVAEQVAEIVQSKSALEAVLGHPVRSFAYPYGSAADYTLETVTAVREAGFECACANFEGAVNPGTDPYQLPRHIVRDWDGETFAQRLREWFLNG
jgi:peptidoglycan/xylan/chitin deacetylase (PgdA/CDA1 family)